MRIFSNLYSQSGQAVLIMILSVVIMATVALGLYASSLSDYASTASQDRSQSAFTAAEGGAETVLNQDTGSIQPSQEIYFTETEERANVETEQNRSLEVFVHQNSITTLQLEGGNAQRVVIRWDKSANKTICNPKPAGLLIDRWRRVGSQINVLRYSFEAAGCPRTPGPLIQVAPADTTTNTPFRNRVAIGTGGANDPVLNSEDLFLRLQPIFADTDISAAAAGNSQLPLQIIETVSTGTSDNTEEARAIEVTKTIPDLPEIFDYVLFSGSALVKDIEP